MNDFDKAVAELSNINHTIARIAQMKPRMSTAEYNRVVAHLYERKRAVQARLRAQRPVSKNDLRVVTREAHYE
jgi:hypothetical protein